MRTDSYDLHGFLNKSGDLGLQTVLVSNLTVQWLHDIESFLYYSKRD